MHNCEIFEHLPYSFTYAKPFHVVFALTGLLFLTFNWTRLIVPEVSALTLHSLDSNSTLYTTTTTTPATKEAPNKATP
jgi:hypothetical protein